MTENGFKDVIGAKYLKMDKSVSVSAETDELREDILLVGTTRD